MNFLQTRQVFGDPIVVLRQNPNFQTINSAFEDIPGVTTTITSAPAGDYLLAWSYRSNNSKSNTSAQTEPRFNDLALTTNTVSGIVNLGNGLGEQFSGFGEFTILNVDLKISIALRRSAGNGFARANTLNLAVYRIR